MINRPSYKERSILSNLPFCANGPTSGILYVYFIIVKNKIIYIGKTGNPLTRERGHRTWLNAMGIDNYKIKVYGPIEKSAASEIERTELCKRKNSKHLINKNSKNEKRDKFYEKFSVKNYRQNVISIIRKGSEVKTMVC